MNGEPTIRGSNPAPASCTAPARSTDGEENCRGVLAALDGLAGRIQFAGREWRVLVLVLATPSPMSARRLAAELRLPYTVVKRLVRGLVAWRLLGRRADGLVA